MQLDHFLLDIQMVVHSNIPGNYPLMKLKVTHYITMVTRNHSTT